MAIRRLRLCVSAAIGPSSNGRPHDQVTSIFKTCMSPEDVTAGMEWDTAFDRLRAHTDVDRRIACRKVKKYVRINGICRVADVMEVAMRFQFTPADLVECFVPEFCVCDRERNVLVWFVFLAQARWVAMRRYRMSWPNECDVLQYIRSTSNTTAAEEASNRARVVAMIAADGGDDEDENGLLDRWRHCVEVGLRDMGIHGIVENRIRRFDVFGYHSLCVTRVIEMIKSGEYVRRSCRVVFDYLDQIESGAADM